MSHNDLSGMRFGRLLVQSFNSKIIGGTKWNCLCDCGNAVIVRSGELRKGKTKSCGCFRKEFISIAKRSHGYRRHPLYGVWNDIKNRCFNSNRKSYKNYGGRGITMCDEWRKNPKSFIDWCLSHGWMPGVEIDRENNDGNYEPSNCRFVTPIINANNKRNNVKVHYNGRFMGMRELSEISNGVPGKTILRRIRDFGWDIDKAVNTPLPEASRLREEAKNLSYMT